jgi:hypothetical protein
MGKTGKKWKKIQLARRRRAASKLMRLSAVLVIFGVTTGGCGSVGTEWKPYRDVPPWPIPSWTNSVGQSQ